MRTLVVVVVCACGGGSKTQPVVESLVISPTPHMLGLINGATSARLLYTAIVRFSDFSTKDVTADTTFAIDPAVGSFAGPLLTATAPAVTEVSATYESLSATAALTVRPQIVYGSLPQELLDRFAGAQHLDVKLVLAYPQDGAVAPRNLESLDVTWDNPTSSDVFEITMSTATTDFITYGQIDSRFNNGTQRGTFPGADWQPVLANDPFLTLRIRALQIHVPDGASCTPQTGLCPIHQSCDLGTLTCVDDGGYRDVAYGPDRLLRLGDHELRAGLTYEDGWNGAPSIDRVDLGKPFRGPETFAGGTECTGCHVTSRDGSQIAMMRSPSAPAYTTKPGTLDLAYGTALRSSQVTGTFSSFTPDGTQLFVVDHGVITVRSTADLSTLATLSDIGYATMPAVSPDGHAVAYVRAAGPTSDWDFIEGSIIVRPYDSMTHVFGTARVLVGGRLDFAPSWSPDGAWLLYTDAAGHAYRSDSSTLWVVRADGTTPPIPLASTLSYFGESWGSFAPVSDTLDHGGEMFYWIAFQSDRRFPWQERPTQLWLTAFFPERAIQGQDPSTPPLWLPFQDPTHDNYRPQFSDPIATGLTLTTVGNGNILPGNPITVTALYRDDAGMTMPATDVVWTSYDARLVVTNMGGGNALVAPSASGFDAIVGVSGRGLSALMTVHAD